MDQGKRKILLITLLVFGGLFCFYKLADMVSPGSYAHAEEYELDYSEAEVINAINKFKVDNPDLAGPSFLDDGKTNSTDHWYNIYFYYKDENKIVFTWTRPSEKNRTTFAFVSLNDGLTLGNWKDVNDDFGFSENRMAKRTFEERILKPLEKQLTHGK